MPRRRFGMPPRIGPSGRSGLLSAGRRARRASGFNRRQAAIEEWTGATGIYALAPPRAPHPRFPAHRRQYVTVTNHSAAQGYWVTGAGGVSSACGPTAWGGCDDACRSTRDGHNPSTAGAPACPCCSGDTASAYRNSGCSDTHRTWHGDRRTGTATRRGGRGRRSDQSAARAIVRSGSTPARTNSS